MQSFAEQHANFQCHLHFSEKPAQPGMCSGFVHEAVREGLLRTYLDIGALEFYVCGPPGMLSATRTMLRSLGVDDANVAYDDFKI